MLRLQFLRESSDGLLPLITSALIDWSGSLLKTLSPSKEKARLLSVVTRFAPGDVSEGAERICCAIRGLMPLLVLAGGWYTPNKADAGCVDAC